MIEDEKEEEEEEVKDLEEDSFYDPVTWTKLIDTQLKKEHNYHDASRLQRQNVQRVEIA